MKKFIGVALAAACACPSQAAGEQTKLDTTRVNNLNEVVVKAVRAPKSSPFAVENIKKTELERFASSGKELPMLFARTPGVLAWSENGVGTGTVYMRMRGAADSRINVTVDGVPLNSPEDQCVFWANMNLIISLANALLNVSLNVLTVNLSSINSICFHIVITKSIFQRNSVRML